MGILTVTARNLINRRVKITIKISIEMAKKFALALLIASFFSPFFLQAKKLSPKDLPEQYRKWLEEEVVYIIVPIEREVFLKLENDRERDLFIEAFWKHRDTIQATPENEFKEEHYRRIKYANRFFGRGTPKPGWRTDRGRIYIILGAPNDIQRFEGKTMTYPSEVWFYQGKTNLGLPPKIILGKRKAQVRFILS